MCDRLSVGERASRPSLGLPMRAACSCRSPRARATSGIPRARLRFFFEPAQQTGATRTKPWYGPFSSQAREALSCGSRFCSPRSSLTFCSPRSSLTFCSPRSSLIHKTCSHTLKTVQIPTYRHARSRGSALTMLRNSYPRLMTQGGERSRPRACSWCARERHQERRSHADRLWLLDFAAQEAR